MFNLLGIFVENVTKNVNMALQIMWQGVLAIFVVIGIIILLTYILNKATQPKKKKDDDNDN